MGVSGGVSECSCISAVCALAGEADIGDTDSGVSEKGEKKQMKKLMMMMMMLTQYCKKK